MKNELLAFSVYRVVLYIILVVNAANGYVYKQLIDGTNKVKFEIIEWKLKNLNYS
jgi:hypothetical protein